MTEPVAPIRRLTLFLVAGEHSGDLLGAKLMAALHARCGDGVHFLGVGGDAMAAQGLASEFPLADVAVMGPLSILPRLPRIVRRVHATVRAAIAARPDAVVIIDAPEFTHPIARRIRRRAPAIPIIDYVSPSVWAWRPGRARRMRPYVDHILALLPFEPEAHVRLGGPPCTYVGHPLIEQMPAFAAADAAGLARRLALDPARPVLVMLPGSRSSEAGQLLDPFCGAVSRLASAGIACEVLVPAVAHLRELIAGRLAAHGIEAHLLDGEDDKRAAFKLARVALAASGTVTLELALAGTPMVVGYKVDPLAAPFLRRMITASTIILPNLVLGENVFKEYVQEDCTPEQLAAALAELMADGPVRARQLAALARVPQRMRLDQGSPSEAAADVVLGIAQRASRGAA